MTDAEQGPRHRWAGVPSWISAGAAVLAAIAGVVFGIVSLGSSDSASSPPTTRSSTPSHAPPGGNEPSLSPPRIVTVRQAPPPIVSASGTAAHFPSGALVYVGVRTVPAASAGSQASGKQTSAWELSTRGSSVDAHGMWKVVSFSVPDSVEEPYEFFAVATTSGFVGAISNSEGATAPACQRFTEPVAGRRLVFGCEVAKSTRVRYTSG